MVFRVLDATSFYAGIPFSSQEKCFTTPQVFDEIKHIKKNHDAVQALLDLGRLEVIQPDKKNLDHIVEKANQTGDRIKLSNEDISILALCIQLKGEIVTDDFTVSNVAKHLGLKVIPLMTKGISKILENVYSCPACNKIFEKKSKCPICGTKLKKLAKRKSSSNPVSKRAII